MKRGAFENMDIWNQRITPRLSFLSGVYANLVSVELGLHQLVSELSIAYLCHWSYPPSSCLFIHHWWSSKSMAPMRGNKKNMDIVRELEPPVQEAHKIVKEESRTSKDVEIEVLRKEVETLTKTLWNNRNAIEGRNLTLMMDLRIPLLNRITGSREERTIACEHRFLVHIVREDHRTQDTQIVIPISSPMLIENQTKVSNDRNHHGEPLGFHSRAPIVDSRCARGPPNHRCTIPGSQHPQDHWASHLVFHKEDDYERDLGQDWCERTTKPPMLHIHQIEFHTHQAKIASQSALIEHCEISIAYRQPSIAHRGSNKHHRVSTLRS